MAEANQPATKDQVELARRVNLGPILRKEILGAAIGQVRRAVELMEAMGCDVKEGYDLVLDGIQKLDLAVPEYPCEWCLVRGQLVTNCLCRGRGWFARNEMDLFIHSRHRATLVEAGDKRTFAKILEDLAKRSPEPSDE